MITGLHIGFAASRLELPTQEIPACMSVVKIYQVNASDIAKQLNFAELNQDGAVFGDTKRKTCLEDDVWARLPALSLDALDSFRVKRLPQDGPFVGREHRHNSSSLFHPVTD